MYLFELPDSLPLLLQTFLLALLLCSLYLFLRGFLVLHSGVEHLLGVLAAHLFWLRLLLLFVVVAVGAAAPCFHTLAVIIPLFFPRVAIAVRPLMDKRNKNGDGKEGEGK